MPYLAVIHPWNEKRVKKSKIEFLSATKIARLHAKEEFDFNGLIAGRPILVHVNKGELVEYLRYDSEGQFEIRFRGKQYTADQDLLQHVQQEHAGPADMDLGAIAIEEDWAVLTCENANRAYIFVSDIRLYDDKCVETYVAGISDPGPGQTDYGNARDLTPAEAMELESNRAAQQNVSEQCQRARSPR